MRHAKEKNVDAKEKVCLRHRRAWMRWFFPWMRAFFPWMPRNFSSTQNPRSNLKRQVAYHEPFIFHSSSRPHTMIRSLAIFLLCAACSVCDAAPIQCSGDAIAQARKLLIFHFGPDNRIEIDPSVKELPSMVNPANRKQKFKVLEVWGTIYKGQYRMRFIYYSLTGSDCTLMGQEILEYASL